MFSHFLKDYVLVCCLDILCFVLFIQTGKPWKIPSARETYMYSRVTQDDEVQPGVTRVQPGVTGVHSSVTRITNPFVARTFPSISWKHFNPASGTIYVIGMCFWRPFHDISYWVFYSTDVTRPISSKRGVDRAMRISWNCSSRSLTNFHDCKLYPRLFKKKKKEVNYLSVKIKQGFYFHLFSEYNSWVLWCA